MEVVFGHKFQAVDERQLAALLLGFGLVFFQGAFVEELEVFGAVVQRIARQELEEVLGQLHVVLDVVERHFGFDHPEFGQVACGVGVLGAECGAKCVDLTQGQRIGFAFQLAGNREVGFASKEVFFIVDVALVVQRGLGGIQGSDAEHGAGALGIRAGDDRGVDIVETAVVKKLMDGKRHGMTHTHDGAEGVGAGPQMGDLAQIFQAWAVL